MDDIELVIKIPKEEYEFCKEQWDTECLDVLTIAVKYGTLLPKGHGRLIDADKLLETWYDDFCKFMTQTELNSMNDIIKNAPTIIEVDKEGSE